MAFPKVGVQAEVQGYNTFMSRLGKMSSGIAGVGKTAAKVAISGVAVLGTATAALGVGLVKLASDSAELETVQAAFKGIAESAGSSQKEMLAALKKGSLGMVTQKDLMKTYNEAAQLVGTTFAGELPNAMGYLSKVSAATGQDMGFMLDSLVKGVGRLSPMILDNLGIQVTLADATANAAAQFGVEADELTKTQIQTGMMNVVLEKLAENTAAMPEVVGTAAQAQAAFKVALQDTKDQIGLALLPTFTTLMTKVSAFASENLPKLVAAFQENVVPFLEETVVPALETLVGWLADHLPAAVQTASEIWTNVLQPAFSILGTFLVEVLVPKFMELVTFFQETLPIAIQFLTDFWNENGAAILEGVEEVWGIVENIIDIAIGNIETYIEAGMKIIQGDWGGAWEVIKNRVEEVWPLIKGVIETVFNELKDNIIPAALDQIGKIITSAWETLKDPVIPALWEEIKKAVAIVWTALKDEVIPTALSGIETVITNAWETLKDPVVPALWEAIKGVIEDAWDALWKEDGIIVKALAGIQSIIEIAWETLKDPVIPALWEGIKAAIKTVWDALWTTVIPTALSSIQTVIEYAWTWLKDYVVPTLWEGIKSAIASVWTTLTTETIPNFLTTLKTIITDAWETLRDETIPDLWEDIMEAIEDVWNTLIDTTIPNLITELGQVIDTKLLEVEQVFIDTANYMLTVGANIVNNLKQGIENAWQGLLDWFADKISDLTDLLPFSEPKNHSSPLYGLNRAGEAIVYNLMDGMETAWPHLMDATSNMLDELGDLIKEKELGKLFLDAAELLERGGEIGSIADDFADYYDDTVIGPAEDRVEAINDELEIVRAAMERAMAAGDMQAYLGYQDYQNRLLVEQRNLTDDIVASQEQMLRIEQQRADLEFLQSQLDLMDLIAEYELDPDAILGGFEFGLDANVPDLLDALSAAMQEIIAQAEDELGVSSPSKEFMRIGEQAMAGMATGIERMMSLPVATSAIASQQMIDNSRSITIQAGGNTIANGMDQAAFESGIRRIVQDALRG